MMILALVLQTELDTWLRKYLLPVIVPFRVSDGLEMADTHKMLNRLSDSDLYKLGISRAEVLQVV